MLEMKMKDQRVRDLEDKFEKILTKMADTKSTVEGGEHGESEEKPLTKKDLQEMETAKQKKARIEQEQLQARSLELQRSIEAQEAQARADYEDFDTTVESGLKLIKRINELGPREQKKAVAMIQDLQIASQNADKFTIDRYNVADMSYDLGKFLKDNLSDPTSGSDAEKPQLNGKTTEQTGKLTPDQMKRIDKNASRRGSSASLSGSGGQRTVSVEDITIDDVNRMSMKQFEDFRRKHPEKINQLLRS